MSKEDFSEFQLAGGSDNNVPSIIDDSGLVIFHPNPPPNRRFLPDGRPAIATSAELLKEVEIAKKTKEGKKKKRKQSIAHVLGIIDFARDHIQECYHTMRQIHPFSQQQAGFTLGNALGSAIKPGSEILPEMMREQQLKQLEGAVILGMTPDDAPSLLPKDVLDAQQLDPVGCWDIRKELSKVAPNTLSLFSKIEHGLYDPSVMSEERKVDLARKNMHGLARYWQIENVENISYTTLERDYKTNMMHPVRIEGFSFQTDSGPVTVSFTLEANGSIVSAIRHIDVECTQGNFDVSKMEGTSYSEICNCLLPRETES